MRHALGADRLTRDVHSLLGVDMASMPAVPKLRLQDELGEQQGRR
jgi:hypothetical protein